MHKRAPIAPGVLIALGWTVFGIFMTTQSYVVRIQAGHPVPWAKLALVEIPYGWLWGLLTPVVLLLSRRFPLSGTYWKRHLLLHMGAGVFLAIIHDLVIGIVRAAVLPSTAPASLLRDVIAFFDYGVILYWIILLAASALAYIEKVREAEIRSLQLEGQLARSALQALRMQLHPHFLFNTLNAISVLVGQDPEGARRTIGRLSEMLRYSLDTSGVQEVPLRKELEVLAKYLAIEQTRFGDRLTVTMDIQPATRDLMVPNFLLQPIVENAIRHGVSRIEGTAHVAISSSRENGTVHLSVHDNGIGLKDGIRDGIGLGNTRERLRQLYGDRHRFTVTNGKPQGVIVSISLPAVTETA